MCSSALELTSGSREGGCSSRGAELPLSVYYRGFEASLHPQHLNDRKTEAVTVYRIVTTHRPLVELVYFCI